MSVFIINNEWDTSKGSGTEIVGACYFETEDDAWDALNVIAGSHEIHLPPADTSFVTKDDDDDYESYYIEELIKHG